MARVKDVMGKIKGTHGQINPIYDMDTESMDSIYKASNGPFEMICNGFRLGYAQGMKAAKSELKEKATTV